MVKERPKAERRLSSRRLCGLKAAARKPPILRGWFLLLLSFSVFQLFSFYAHGAHLFYDLNDFNIAGTLSNRTVRLYPKSTPRAEGNEIISSDYKFFVTDTNGTYTLSNVVQGVYSNVVVGPRSDTVFLILVPDTNVTLNVNTLLAVSTNLPSHSVGFSQAAANAIFVRKTNSWSTGQALTNAAFRGSTNVFQHTNGAPSAGAVMVTDGTNAFWTSAIAFGLGAVTTNLAMAVGEAAKATNDAATALGYSALAGGLRSVSVGREATATGNRAVAIGASAVATHDFSTAIGRAATTTATNQIMLGTASDRVVLPGGVTATALPGSGGIIGQGGNGDLMLTNVVSGGTPFPAYIVTTAETGLSNVLNAAIARMIIVSNGTYTVDGDWKVTNTATVKFMPGAVFSIDSGKTLNIRGRIDALAQQIFSGSGIVTFSNNFVLSEVKPEWWGAVADLTVDSSAAWQKCADAASTRTAADLDFTGTGLSASQQSHVRAHHYPLLTIRPASGSIFRMTNTVTISQHYFGVIDFNGSWMYCEGNGSTNGVFHLRDCREMRIENGFFTCHQENPVFSIFTLQNLISPTNGPNVTPTHMFFENIQAYGNLGGMKFFVYARATNAANNEFHMFSQCGAHDYSRGFALIPESQMKNWIFVNCSMAGDFRMNSYGISTWDPELAPDGSGSYNAINCQGGGHRIADFMATGFEPMTIQGCNIENSRRFLAQRFLWVETNSFSWATNGTSFFLTNTTIAAWCSGTNRAITNSGFTFEYPASKDIWEYLTATNTIVRITNNSGARPYNPTTGGGTLFSIVQVGASGITNVIETGGHQQYNSTQSAPMLIAGLDWSGGANESWDGHGVIWGQLGPLTFKDCRIYEKTRPWMFNVYGGPVIGMDGTVISFEDVTFKTLLATPTQVESRIFINRGDNSQSTNGIDTGLVRINSRGTILADSSNNPSNVVDRITAEVFRSHLSAVDMDSPFQIWATNKLIYHVSTNGTVFMGRSNDVSLVIGATNAIAGAVGLKGGAAVLDVRLANDSAYATLNAATITSWTLPGIILRGGAGSSITYNGLVVVASPSAGVAEIYNDASGTTGNTNRIWGSRTNSTTGWWLEEGYSQDFGWHFLRTRSSHLFKPLVLGVGTNWAFQILTNNFDAGTGGAISINNTVDTTASTGMTINKSAGRVRLSAGQQTYLLTNNLATANSIVTATVNTDDATALNVKAIPSAGLITLKCNAATTANTDISFFISSP